MVALDVGSLRSAELLLKDLKNIVKYYKVGINLFTSEGPKAIGLVRKYGGEVFLDLKLHDIPQSVQEAVRAAGRHGAYAISIHLCGAGKGKMIEAAMAVHPRPKIWGITVLTSFDWKDFEAVGYYKHSMQETVLHLAKLGVSHNIEGIVCSGHEAKMLRSKFGERVHLITPGIRPAKMQTHDQKRTMTPGEAASLKVDFAVVGRPIIDTPDPASAAERILKEIQSNG